MATGAPATELGVWDGSRRGSKSAADDEAASQQKDWHGSGSWRSAQVRRPQGAQLQEAVDAATVADVVAAAAACIEEGCSAAAITCARTRSPHFKKNDEV